MVDHPMDTSCTNDGEPSTAPGVSQLSVSPITFLSNPLDGEMSLAVLGGHCVRELNTFRRGEPFRRAIAQRDQESWAGVQLCFGGVVLDWLRRHPKSADACRLQSEEHYVAQVFQRFWQDSASHQRVQCNTLAAALHSLRVSFHGAILDTLRAYERPWVTSLPEPGGLREPYMEEVTSSSEVWEMLQMLLPDWREHRIAYLLFHCGLKPPEIVRVSPLEWSDNHEIYRLQHTILQRFLRNAEHLH